MGQGGFRLLFAMAACLAALAWTGTAGAAQSCASRLLADWKDGRIDQTYAVSCYRTALADMPEDVRVYSTAQSDITRALQARVSAATAEERRQQGRRDGGLAVVGGRDHRGHPRGCRIHRRRCSVAAPHRGRASSARATVLLTSSGTRPLNPRTAA